MNGYGRPGRRRVDVLAVEDDPAGDLPEVVVLVELDPAGDVQQRGDGEREHHDRQRRRSPRAWPGGPEHAALNRRDPLAPAGVVDADDRGRRRRPCPCAPSSRPPCVRRQAASPSWRRGIMRDLPPLDFPSFSRSLRPDHDRGAIVRDEGGLYRLRENERPSTLRHPRTPLERRPLGLHGRDDPRRPVADVGHRRRAGRWPRTARTATGRPPAGLSRATRAPSLGSRGTVRRWDEGTCIVTVWEADRVELTLDGAQLTGPLVLWASPAGAGTSTGTADRPRGRAGGSATWTFRLGKSAEGPAFAATTAPRPSRGSSGRRA